MNQPLTEAWADISRLQNSRAAAKNEADIRACEIMIDRQIDRIAVNQMDPDNPVEVRQTVAADARRERHRAQLVRRHGPNSIWGQFSSPSPEVIYLGRQALDYIIKQASSEDASLLLSVGLGEVPQVPGLAMSSARKRLQRLRARLSHLAPCSTAKITSLEGYLRTTL